MSAKRWTDIEILQAIADGKVDDVPLEYESDFDDKDVRHNIQVMEDLVEENWVRGNISHRTGMGEFVIPNFRITEAGKSKLKSSNAPQATSKSTFGFDARVYTVMIASPSDTAAERDLVEKAVHRWNADHSWSRKIVLLPIRWEADAIPHLGADGQTFINNQLVARADIVIAVFHSLMGSATPRASSGTEEEITLAHESGAKVHIYFSQMPHPSGVNPDQLTKLNEFRERMKSKSLYSTFADLPHLTENIRSALEKDVAEFTA
jgi:hypothetical protein